MRQLGIVFALLAAPGCILLLAPVNAHAQAQWGQLKGKIIFKGPLPKQVPLNFGANPDKNVCSKDKEAFEENWVVDPKTKGIKDIFVWIRPVGAAKSDPFPAKSIHPDLAKPAKPTVELDQPCCRFIPHALAVREGQQLIIKNSASIAHNSKWDSSNNGNFNPIIPAMGEFKIPKALVAETSIIVVQCSIHPWMNSRIRIFDNPYYALTDAEGNFEIKNAPVGKFNIFYQHNSNGWVGGVKGRNGYPITIKEGNNDLGTIEMAENK